MIAVLLHCHHQYHVSSFWECCWVVCDKFTCHFDVCRCKMCGGLVTDSELSAADIYRARLHQLARAGTEMIHFEDGT